MRSHALVREVSEDNRVARPTSPAVLSSTSPWIDPGETRIRRQHFPFSRSPFLVTQPTVSRDFSTNFRARAVPAYYRLDIPAGKSAGVGARWVPTPAFGVSEWGAGGHGATSGAVRAVVQSEVAVVVAHS